MSTFTYSQVPWFSQPSKGFDLFAVPPQSSVRKSGQGYGFQDGNQSPVVVRRRIAHRGHEIFVATGKEVRWASLPLVKSQWERAQVGIQKSIRDRRMRASSESDRDSGSQSESESESESDGGEENEDGLAHGYKRLAVPIRAEIQQLLISPNQQLLAIVTSQTCHVVIIPDSSLLASSDSAPVRAKTFTLGSTTHALDQPPLCTALWHPLGKDGGCLVTVAAGGIVRLWELNLESRWSFEEPALCVDLIDLANAETSDQTIGSPQAQRRGFTPDAVDFELTSACFGTAYSAGQSAWSPMTLWLTTTEADIYALCPFLPSNFQLPEYALDNFILNTIAGAEASWEDSEGSGFDKKHTTDRRRWAQDLEDQRSQAATGKPRSLICTFKRPDSLGPVPKLRGPFEIEGAFEEGEVATFTDIYVIGAGQESVDDDKDDDDASSAGDEAATATKIMGMDTVCVVTETGRILINLAQAVEGRWAKKKMSNPAKATTPSMLTVASISTNEGGEEVPAGAAPSFTVDSITTSSLLVNYGSSLVNISLGGFFEQLSEELNNIDDDGAEFRLGLLQKAPSIDVRRLSPAMDDPELAIVGLVAIEPDQSGGVTILGATSMGPLAMSRHIQEPQMLLLAGPTDPGASQLLPPAPLQRSVYLPSPSFSKTTNVERLLTENADPLLRRLLNERPLRLSSASLKIFLQAHRILSSETVTVNRAAAGLFRRVEALQEEFRQQIATCSELLTWIQQREEDEDQDEETTQTEEDEGLAEEQDSDREADGSWPRKKSERRMLRARNRQEALISRWSALQRKADRLKRLRGGGELSGKEKEWMAWISEVEKDVLGVNVWEPDRVRRVVSVNMKDLVARDGAAAQDGEAGGEGRKGPKERFEEVMRLGRRLVEDCEGISRRTAEQDDEVRPADATEDAQTEAVEKDSRRSSVSYSTSANANANANNSSKMGPSTNRRSVMGSSRGTAMNTGLRNLGVPKIVRQEKMEVIRGLLERESALVRAAQEKLERLTVR